MSSVFEALVDQALRLSAAERGELASRLLHSLDPDSGDGVSAQDWNAAWTAELDRRIHDVRDRRAELVDGDDVLSELREIAERP
ncbi:MAG: addiction module protein [Kofleriaceae bacterium]